jgi:Tfp pilus assembly protein PilV
MSTTRGLHSTLRRSQRGAALFESLIAFVFLAVASLTAAQVQSQLRLHGDLARQRSEAVRLGARELESLRAWSTLTAASGASSYAAIVDAESSVDADANPVNNTDYRIVRRVDDAAFAGAKGATVAVEWADRSGGAQQVVLDSVIARNDPAWSGALAVGAGAGVARGGLGRSPTVPVTARSLGGGRSALKTSPTGSAAIVFDDRSGDIVSRCDGIAAATATRDLTTSDLSSCSAGIWRLLSGTIRFSSAVPPLDSQASDTPPALTVLLALSGGTYAAAPDCSAEPMKTVRYSAGGSLHIDAVALDATPASLGLASWNDSGDRHLAYRCIVTPRADGRWSGRSTLLPSGWTIGAGSSDHKVCRYAADRDGSGAIDANIEHPADYVDVAGSLPAQNFLVVRGDQSCPPASDDANLLTAGLGTVQHQP